MLLLSVPIIYYSAEFMTLEKCQTSVRVFLQFVLHHLLNISLSWANWATLKHNLHMFLPTAYTQHLCWNFNNGFAGSTAHWLLVLLWFLQHWLHHYWKGGDCIPRHIYWGGNRTYFWVNMHRLGLMQEEYLCDHSEPLLYKLSKRFAYVSLRDT